MWFQPVENAYLLLKQALKIYLDFISINYIRLQCRWNLIIYGTDFLETNLSYMEQILLEC